MGKKNNSYTASYKLKVISFAKQFGNSAAEREFGILESSVRYWMKQEEALRTTKRDSGAFHGPKAGKYPALEDDLLNYFKELRNHGIAVTRDMLQLRARELAKSLNISDNEVKASRGWLRRFMTRKGLSLRTRTTLCQKLPRDFTENAVAEIGGNDVNDSLASEGDSCLSSDDEN
jgi:DNA-binding transcriptional regulator YiaG